VRPSSLKSTSNIVAAGALLGGKYRIERMLGEGGMGIVVAATNEALRQRVAIKLMRAGAIASPKALGRFEREARAAASLRSEHVARVLDVGKFDDGQHYMVMEFLDGQDLSQVLDGRGRLPIADAVDWVIQACEAIAEAHSIGIVHRDLKPRNLFLTQTVDGRPLVKVLDFGISKMEDTGDDLTLTKTTEVIGSPSYMSPEQLRASKEVDARTDLWALGVILYELLTGRLPFYAATVTDLVAVVLTETPPSLQTLRPEVPDALAAAVARCLGRRREDRFGSVVDLVRAIAPFGGSAGTTMVDRVSGAAASGGRGGISQSGPQPSTPTVVTPPATFADSSERLIPNRVASDGAPFPAATPTDRPNAAGAAPRALHGGTSVAWGETEVAAPRAPAPPAPIAAAPRRGGAFVAIGVLCTVLVGAGAGAIYYVKRASAGSTTVASAPRPPPERGQAPDPSLPPSTTMLSAGAENASGPAINPAMNPAPVPAGEPGASSADAGSGTSAHANDPHGRAPGPHAAMAPKPRTGKPGASGAQAPSPPSSPAAAPPRAPSGADDLSDIGRR